jgi:LysM repeat protein
VQYGETLSSIARDVGIPYPWIQQSNPGVDDSLRVGQVLAIPSPDVLLPLPVVENKRIVISLSWQRLWAYENGTLLWEWPVSTGIASSPTAPGVFQVQSHESNAYAASWDLWMPYFMGIYRPAPTSNVMNGFHGFPTRDGVSLLWTGDLGRPVTYGCILLGHTSAPLLYRWAEAGTIVEIRE